MKLVAPIHLYLPEAVNQRDAMRELVRTILIDSHVLDVSCDKERQELIIKFETNVRRSSDNAIANDHQYRSYVNILACEGAFARLCGCSLAVFTSKLKHFVAIENRATVVSKIDTWRKGLQEIFEFSDLQDTRLNFSAVKWYELDKTGKGLIKGTLVIEPQKCQQMPIDIAA